MSENLPQKSHFLVYEAGDGTLKSDVRLEDETVWLSQRLMADLFQKDVRTINEHIQNVYDEGELEPETTIRKFRIVQRAGSAFRFEAEKNILPRRVGHRRRLRRLPSAS